MDLAELTSRQRVGLWLDGRTGLHSVADARAFLGEVALALRYGAASELPLASMYRATQRQVPVPEDERTAHARAFDLTNALLSSGEVVEINVIANRLALAQRDVMPAIYALRRRGKEPPLSRPARQAFEFILSNDSATSGDIRRLLNIHGQRRPDAADLALSELQRELVIDRGPSGAASTGVFYMTREGYPYRALTAAHPELLATSLQMNRPEAAVDLLRRYLHAAVFIRRRKLLSLFQLLLSANEVDDAIGRLVSDDVVQLETFGRAELVVYWE